MKNITFAAVALIASILFSPNVFGDDAAVQSDSNLASDLNAIQGSCELLHGNNPNNQPKTRSVKTIKGNTETLRRYNIALGKMTHEHSVEFELSETGSVRVLSFYPPGGTTENGLSYVYKIDGDEFYDIPGMLHGNRYRNYTQKPVVYRWKRITRADQPSRDEQGAE